MGIKQAKSTAWKYFSLYIRKRDSLCDSFRCCTCGEVKPFRLADAGHFIPGRSNSILFEETNCHAQCSACNRFKQGKWPEYYKFMLEKYGQIEIDRLIDLKSKIVKLKESDFREIAKKYKALSEGFSD